eukprot:scaffold66332_cov46-Prasinocladus_malaysianus.AAC.2
MPPPGKQSLVASAANFGDTLLLSNFRRRRFSSESSNYAMRNVLLFAIYIETMNTRANSGTIEWMGPMSATAYHEIQS